MATGRKWRLGVIGCGAWGPNHIRNFSALPNAEVVGAADLQPDRLARVKAIVPGVATFTDTAEMMATARPDAVVISTPTMTHFDVVLGNPGRVTGYVCECCQPLAGSGRTLICKACGLRYVKTKHGVSRVEVAPKAKARSVSPKPKAKADR